MKLIAGLIVAFAAFVVAGCNGGDPPAGQRPTPTLTRLETPDRIANAWVVTPFPPPPAVLPTRGRGVRLTLTAPQNSEFAVSIRGLDGSITPLPRNSGTPAAPEAGYFQIIGTSPSGGAASYVMYVRAPASLSDPANYDVLVVDQSLRTNVTDSNPMVVGLRRRPTFTVTVNVVGNGRVTSNPPGIQCGASSTSGGLSPCTFEFGPGPVTLTPASADLNTTRFVGWSGNCPANQQVCAVALTGIAPLSATATFGASTVPPDPCPAAPLLSGLRWIDRPSCATGNIAGHPGITLQCDSQGYFCCEPQTGANAPRCGGADRLESAPDCRHRAPTGMLRQPGGCYEVSP